MNVFVYDSIPFVAAGEYKSWVSAHPDCIALVISPDEQQMSLIPILASVHGGMHCFVTPVTETDSHLVEAVRVPRIRVYLGGTLIHNVLFSKEEPDNLFKVLKQLRLA